MLNIVDNDNISDLLVTIRFSLIGLNLIFLISESLLFVIAIHSITTLLVSAVVLLLACYGIVLIVADVIKRAMAQGLLEQQGEVISGPGAQRDRQYFIDKLTSRQSDHVKRARKHATELSVKQVLAKQTIIQQQQVREWRTWCLVLSLYD